MTNTWKRESNGWRSRSISRRCIEELVLRYLDEQQKSFVWASTREIADYFNLNDATDRAAIGLFLRANLNFIFKGGPFRVADRKITWEPGKTIRYQIIRRSW